MFAAMVVLAQSPYKNSALAITQPGYGEVLNAGQTYKIKWTPSAAIPAVDIVLREGNMANFEHESNIARGVPNNGEFTWTIPKNLATSVAMSVMIHDTRDPTIVNYSPYFTIYGYPQLAGALPPPSLTSSTSTTSTTMTRETETIRLYIQEKRPQHLTEDSRLVTKEPIQNSIKLEQPRTSLSKVGSVNPVSVESTGSNYGVTSRITTASTTFATRMSQSKDHEASSSTSIEPASNGVAYSRASMMLFSIVTGFLMFFVGY